MKTTKPARHRKQAKQLRRIARKHESLAREAEAKAKPKRRRLPEIAYGRLIP